MKKTILFTALLATTISATAQKKNSYKNDYFNAKLRYNYLPAVCELENALRYTLTISDADNRTVVVGTTAERPEVDVTTLLGGKKYVTSDGDFNVQITTTQLTRTGNNLQVVASATTPPVNSCTYKMNYSIAYRLVITDSKTSTVLLDSIYNSTGFTTYPTDYGGSAPSTEAGLTKMYNAEQGNAVFQQTVSHNSVKNFAQTNLKERFTRCIGYDVESIILNFAHLKTKDPFFAQLDSAQLYIESTLKTISKNNLGDTKINWNTQEFQEQLLKAHTIYNNYLNAPEVEQMEDAEVKKKFQNDLIISIFYLDVMLGKYNEAQRLLNISKGVSDKNEQVREQNQNNPTTLSNAFGSLKTSDAEKMYLSMHLMESVLEHEAKYHEKHKKHYGFY
jgi:hypothetical protein